MSSDKITAYLQLSVS